MSSTLWAVSLALALGQGPYGTCSTCNNGGGGYVDGAVMGGGYGGGNGGVNISVGNGPQGFYTGSGGTYDPLYPYDHHEPWVHHYIQEIPAYGGYHFFRPYNYKHLLSQSQVAGGWGLSPTNPYSQEYFRRNQPGVPVEPKTSLYRSPGFSVDYGRLQSQRALPAMRMMETSQVVSQDPNLQGYHELQSSRPIDPAVYVRRPATGSAALPPGSARGVSPTSGYYAPQSR